MIGTLIGIGSIIVLSFGYFFAWTWWNKRKFRLEMKRENDEFEAWVKSLPPSSCLPPAVERAFIEMGQAMIDDLRSHEK